MNKLVEKLDAGPVICAEGYLFELERRGYLQAGPFVPEVVLEHPEVVTRLHEDFVHAGSDIVEAFTYYAHREKLQVIGRENDLEKINRTALQVARNVAQQHGALLAGNVCNTNVWDPSDTAKQNEVRRMFEEMIGWAVDEKADIIICETFYHAGEAFAALEIAKGTGLPVVLTLAPLEADKMTDDADIVETCQKLEQAGADVVGLNCFRGPQTMMPWLKKIRSAVSCHVGALPVPYRTTEQEPTFFTLPDSNGCSCPSPYGRPYPTALDPLYCNRYEIEAFAKEAYGLGIRYLGVCCGASPMHIRQVAEAVGLQTRASRYSENMGTHYMLGRSLQQSHKDTQNKS